MPDRLLNHGINGLAFLRALYRMIHAARIYRDNNDLIHRSVGGFQRLLKDLTVGGGVSLVLWRGRFHLDGEKLPYRRDAAGVVNAMVEYFSQRGIGNISFLESAGQVSLDELLNFVRLLNESTKDVDPQSWIDEKLREEGCLWVQVFPVQDRELSKVAGDATLEDKRRDRACRAYFDAVEMVKEVANKATKGMVGVRKARRLAQAIVDLVREDISLMIGLATIKEFDDYTYTHSVNVALLSTCLGRHIGMSDVSLEYLAVCGLFHDLGKVGVSKEILHKQGALSQDEWECMKSHPLIGVGKILQLNAPPPYDHELFSGPSNII